MTSTVDEEIIRKRLLLDGEGAGDDRKLTMILKSFLKVRSIREDRTGTMDQPNSLNLRIINLSPTAGWH